MTIAQAEHGLPVVALETEYSHDGVSHHHPSNDSSSEERNTEHRHFPGGPTHSHSEGHLPGFASLLIAHSTPVLIGSAPEGRVHFEVMARLQLAIAYFDLLYRPPIV
jgi:hypothetical protein